MRFIRCANCGKEDEHHAKGLCFNCYRKLVWQPKKKECPSCKQVKVIHAKGYCEYCYNKIFYTEYSRLASRKQYSGITKEVFDKLPKKCLICGFDKIFDVHHLVAKSKGGSHTLDNLIVLCPNHHKMLHHADYRQEMLALISERMDKSTHN
ncbi:HNH endonuclease [Candidatus Woesearchaeota archaeon]|nr:HNH endonuclease [Candidatus Woesearchaeota archaeon]